MGGSGREAKNDVWCSSDSYDWRAATSSAPWGPRWCPEALVFEDKIWLLGGAQTLFDRKNDVWNSADGKNWTCAVSAAAWPPMGGHAAVVHNGRMWVIGGEQAPLTGPDGQVRQYSNGVWSSPNGIDWTTVTASAPWPPRAYHAAASWRGQLWIMGGLTTGSSPSDDPVPLNDVWRSLDGVHWTRAIPAAPWEPREGLQTLPVGNQILVMGGYPGGYTETAFADVWSTTDGEHWFRTAPHPNAAASLWSPRYGHTALFDGSKIWILGGGVFGTVPGSDVWRSDYSPASATNWRLYR